MRTITLLVGLVLAGLIWTLAATLAQEPLPIGKAVEERYGVALRNARWPVREIAVCWENPSAADGSYRGITRQAIAETWERHSDLRFTGWGPCTPASRGIRIKIEDVGPYADAIGRYLDARPNGVVLNFTFQNWEPGCQENRGYCVAVIGAHEFGHALGFTHEQNRPDAPDWCQERAQGTVGDYFLTEYDPSSIMNYCNQQWMGDGQLSQRDIEALQTFYGRP